MTKLSAIIYTYNNERTIRSIVTKTVDYFFDEVIVINSGSTDKTDFAIKRITNKYRFKYYHLPEHIGIGSALMKGVEICQGEIIVFIDASFTKIQDKHFYDMIMPVRQLQVDMVIGMPREIIIDNSYELNKTIYAIRCFRKSTILPLINRFTNNNVASDTFIDTYYKIEGNKIKYHLLPTINKQINPDKKNITKLQTQLYLYEKKRLIKNLNYYFSNN